MTGLCLKSATGAITRSGMSFCRPGERREEGGGRWRRRRRRKGRSADAQSHPQVFVSDALAESKAALLTHEMGVSLMARIWVLFPIRAACTVKPRLTVRRGILSHSCWPFDSCRGTREARSVAGEGFLSGYFIAGAS